MTRVKNWLNHLSLSAKIMFLVSLAVLLFTVSIAFLSYQRMATSLEEEASMRMDEVLRQININIEHSLNECQSSITEFLTGEDVQLYTAGLPGEGLEGRVKRQVAGLKEGSPQFIDARLFLEDITSAGTAFPASMLAANSELAVLAQQPFVWTNASDQSWNRFAYLPTVYCYAGAGMGSLPGGGVWRFDLSADRLFESVRTTDFGSNGSVMVLRDNGGLIYQSSAQEIVANHRDIARAIGTGAQDVGQLLMDIGDTEYFVSYNRENTLGWYIVGIVPRAELQQSAAELRNFIVAVSLLLYLLVMVVLYFILGVFTQRTQRLAQTIRRFGKGDFSVRYKSTATMDEIGELGLQFNHMMDRIERLLEESRLHYQREGELRNENLTLELLKRQAELRALQNQINPHFLFNTLEMVKGMFYEPGARDQVIEVVQALSDMFRYNLDKSSEVPLGEELQHLRDYMFIQNSRFDRQVAMQVNVDAALLGCQVLRFSLEPIVENSIKHGFRARRQNCRIGIEAELVDGRLILLLWDNGCGMEREQLDAMNARLRKGEFEQRERGGLGVCNVNARLQREYGQEFGLRYESEPGRGTKVWMVIPIRDRGEGHG